MTNVFLLSIILAFISFDTLAQNPFDDETNSLSHYRSRKKVYQLELENRISSLNLPAFRNDSLFWTKNLDYLKPYPTSDTFYTGFPIDTIIEFFDVATKIKIKNGYLWFYKITSPTAYKLGVRLQNYQIGTDQYLRISTSCVPPFFGIDISQSEVYNSRELKEYFESKNDDFTKTFFGNILYLAYYTPHKEIENSELKIVGIEYRYPTDNLLSSAPQWIRNKHPEIDFNYYRK